MLNLENLIMKNHKIIIMESCYLHIEKDTYNIIHINPSFYSYAKKKKVAKVYLKTDQRADVSAQHEAKKQHHTYIGTSANC